MPIAIETDKNLLVVALLHAGFEVYAINPRAVARYRERHGQTGKKSDPGDAAVLAGILRTDRHLHRPLPRITDQGAGGQGAGPPAPGGDLGAAPDDQQAAVGAAGVLPAGPGRVPQAHPPRRPGRPGCGSDAARRATPDPEDRQRCCTAVDAATTRRWSSRSTATCTPTRCGQPGAGGGRTRRRGRRADRGRHRHAAQRRRAGDAAGHRVRRAHPLAPVLRSVPGLGPVLAARVLAEIGDDPAQVRQRQRATGLRRHRPGHPRVPDGHTTSELARSATRDSATPATGGRSPP